MKAKQWTLLMVLIVGIVFGITFATQYVGDKKKTDKPKPVEAPRNKTLELTFAVTEHPAKLDPPDEAKELLLRPTTEFEKFGHHDFWFSNDNAEDVQVGLAAVSCVRCSDVLVCVAPDSWRKELAVIGSCWVGGSAPTALPGPAAVRAGLAERGLRDLVDSVKEESMTALAVRSKRSQAVPAGKFGFVRMKWQAFPSPAAQLPDRLSVTLWHQDPPPSMGSTTMLQVGVVLSKGFHMQPSELDLGELRQGDSATQAILIWSVIHADFDVDVASKADPFLRCARIEPLSVGEMATLNEPYKIHRRVLNAYRLHINARERFGEGPADRAEIGAFDQTLRIVPRVAGTPQREMDLRVIGIVRGEVTVEGIERAIRFEPFQVADGATRELILNCDRAAALLKIDRAPSFINAKLEKVPGTGARTQWKLTLEIPPNRVSGKFPRPEVELYRDTAIYLKLDGDQPRRIRIPVVGEATQ